jgi:hypothetical protein
MDLRTEHELPEDALVDAVGRFEFTDDEILRTDVEGRSVADTPRQLVGCYLSESYGPGFDRETGDYLRGDGEWRQEERLWARMQSNLITILIASQYGFSLDWKENVWRVPRRASLGLRVHGYEVDVEPVVGDTLLGYYDADHYEAFWMVLSDADTGEELGRRAFRAPPGVDQRTHEVGTVALNHAFLLDRGIEVVRLVPRDEANVFAVFETDLLDRMEDEYGQGIGLFGAELVRRGDDLDAMAVRGYDSSQATDHEAAFGVPEPADTLHLEDVVVP